ncbi:hypothetical protein [Porphyromonas cangingivalis]|uniref:hypothetical protein n=1 Tax=Porphyromonas cangingivalis TaxID=36874 RepID=UPI001F19D6AF|nr:hypothetical protein [Porphyromonas cangingivalis]
MERQPLLFPSRRTQSLDDAECRHYPHRETTIRSYQLDRDQAIRNREISHPLSQCECLIYEISSGLADSKVALERCESRGGHYRSDYPETLSDDHAYRTEINKHKILKIRLHND